MPLLYIMVNSHAYRITMETDLCVVMLSPTYDGTPPSIDLGTA